MDKIFEFIQTHGPEQAVGREVDLHGKLHRITRFLGAGNDGIVYEVRDNLTGETSFVKLSRERMNGSPSEIKEAQFQAHVMNGQLALQRKEFGDAIKFFDSALKLQPENRIALVNKAIALCQSGDQAAGIDLFDEVLSKGKEDPDILFNKGWALYEAADLKGAWECFDSAIKIEPKHAEAWAGKGYVCLSVDQPFAAEKAFSIALETDPELEMAKRGDSSVKNIIKKYGLKPPKKANEDE